MCGIAGIVGFDAPGRAYAARLAAMRRRLARRGPDGEGSFFGAHVALAHTRLALVDPAHGAQPMTSPDGRYTLVFNGEIYGHDGRLAWSPRSRSDAELLLAALAAEGPDAIAKLDGMFAFFFWDEVRQAGFAARDRLGIKPFAWSWDAGELVFASQASVVALDRGRPRARRDAILEVLVAPCFSGVTDTMFDGVAYLQPGELLRVGRGGIAIERWLPTLPGWPADRGPEGDVALVAAVRAALAPAVARTRRAEAPVGTFLSGGLDSTAIVALAPDLPTWSARFEGHADFDDASSRIVVSDDVPFAEMAARKLSVSQRWVDVRADEVARAIVAVAAIDDALPVWEQEITQHRLFESAHEGGMKAILVGDAADETHHGYHFLLDDEAVASPAALLRRFAGVPIRADVLVDPIGHFDARYRARAAERGLAYGTREQGLAATSALIRELFLPRLLHNGDVHGMHWSVEARVPFGDLALLAAADRVPLAAALRGGVEKHVLREALAGLVPESVRLRRKSALPKPPRVDAAYRELLEAACGARHPLLSALLDWRGVEALLGRPTWDEAARGAAFRIVGLHHWAAAFGVDA